MVESKSLRNGRSMTKVRHPKSGPSAVQAGKRRTGARSLSDMQDYRPYLRQVTAIHNEAIRRLVSNDKSAPLELAAMFEDIANLYLDISDDIRWCAAEARRSAPQPSPKAIRG